MSDVKADPVLDMIADSVAEVVDGGSGHWRSCSGCHETDQGQETGAYPYSQTFRCYIGAGCSECGGIGAVWDNIDYADFAESFLKDES